MDWKKVKPYSFEEFWEHIQHSPQFMNYQHVTYRGKILDFPSEPGKGSTPWLFLEYLKDANYGYEDRMYRVGVYVSAMNFITYHGDFFRKKGLILPTEDGDKHTQMLRQELLQAVHYFVTHNAPHGELNVGDVHPKAVLKLANAFRDALEVLFKSREKRERS